MSLIVFNFLICSPPVLFAQTTTSTSSSENAMHIAAGATITIATYSALRATGFKKGESIIAAGTTAIFLGVLKEILDKKVDQKDIEADGIGATAAMLSIAIIHF